MESSGDKGVKGCTGEVNFVTALEILGSVHRLRVGDRAISLIHSDLNS